MSSSYDFNFEKLEAVVKRAQEKAQNEKKEILVSYSERVKEIDPVLFLEDNVKRFTNDTFFWKEAKEEFFLVGLGISKILFADESTERYKQIYNNWKDLIDHAIIEGQTVYKKGVGPLLFGAFNFMKQHRLTNLWNEYQHGVFYLPQFLLTRYNEETYLTTNCIVSPDKQMDIASILHLKEEIINEISIASHESSINCHIQKDNRIIYVKEEEVKEWLQNVDQAIQQLKNQELKKVVLARKATVEVNQKIDSLQVLKNLREHESNNFLFSFQRNGNVFIGATPERLVSIENDKAYSACIAGSIPRGKTEKEDQQNKKNLFQDEKNRSEHQLVVDMISESFQKICTEVLYKSEPEIMTNPHIFHLYTPIEGKLNKEVTIFDAIEILHPTPALGGTPRELALKLIEKYETFDRGLYGAPIGWVDSKMNGEFVVGIRSALIKGNQAYLFAGCGVVKDSDPFLEYEETKTKLRPMLRALN